MPQKAKDALLSIVQGNPNNITKAELSRRQNNKNKMKLSSDKLRPPGWLSTGAKKDFKTIVGVFEDTEVLNNADVNVIALYCDTLADYKSYRNQLKKHGISIKTDAGIKINPFVREKRNAAQLLDKLANELGLTPNSRTSLAINLDLEEEEDDEF